MSDEVAQVLARRGPLDSGSLAEALAASGSFDAARKRIERSRRRGNIRSTYPVRFDKLYLYYLDAHAGKRYAEAIRRLLPRKPAFDRVFKCLLANKGWITPGQIGKASACLPADDSSASGGRHSLPTLTLQLRHVGLIDEVAGQPDIYRIGKAFGSTGVKCGAFVKKIELEHALLPVFREWLRD